MECFRHQELLSWQVFQSSYSAVLREGLPNESATGVFATDSEQGERHWKDFEKKVVEHVSK